MLVWPQLLPKCRGGGGDKHVSTGLILGSPGGAESVNDEVGLVLSRQEARVLCVCVCVCVCARVCVRVCARVCVCDLVSSAAGPPH